MVAYTGLELSFTGGWLDDVSARDVYSTVRFIRCGKVLLRGIDLVGKRRPSIFSIHSVARHITIWQSDYNYGPILPVDVLSPYWLQTQNLNHTTLHYWYLVALLWYDGLVQPSWCLCIYNSSLLFNINSCLYKSKIKVIPGLNIFRWHWQYTVWCFITWALLPIYLITVSRFSSVRVMLETTRHRMRIGNRRTKSRGLDRKARKEYWKIRLLSFHSTSQKWME